MRSGARPQSRAKPWNDKHHPAAAAVVHKVRVRAIRCAFRSATAWFASGEWQHLWRQVAMRGRSQDARRRTNASATAAGRVTFPLCPTCGTTVYCGIRRRCPITSSWRGGCVCRSQPSSAHGVGSWRAAPPPRRACPIHTQNSSTRSAGYSPSDFADTLQDPPPVFDQFRPPPAKQPPAASGHSYHDMTVAPIGCRMAWDR